MNIPHGRLYTCTKRSINEISELFAYYRKDNVELIKQEDNSLLIVVDTKSYLLKPFRWALFEDGVFRCGEGDRRYFHRIKNKGDDESYGEFKKYLPKYGNATREKEITVEKREGGAIHIENIHDDVDYRIEKGEILFCHFDYTFSIMSEEQFQKESMERLINSSKTNNE